MTCSFFQILSYKCDFALSILFFMLRVSHGEAWQDFLHSRLLFASSGSRHAPFSNSIDPDNLQLYCFLGLAALFCCSFLYPLGQPRGTLQMVQIAPRMGNKIHFHCGSFCQNPLLLATNFNDTHCKQSFALYLALLVSVTEVTPGTNQIIGFSGFHSLTSREKKLS